MKKARGKGMVCVFILALIAVLGWSMARADFYVVGAGKRAKKTILVSPESTETASGTALLNAINGITDAGVTNPYLVIIEPGVYDIVSTSLQMKEYVDIQGSGENVTKIRGAIGSSNWGVLMGADNAEVRFVTVENTGGGNYAYAIYNSGVSPTITHVTASASGGSIWNVGVYNDNASSPTMTHVTATASGGTSSYGVRNHTFSSTMTNVTATASGALNNNGILNSGSSPTMTNVTATGSGGPNNYGVWNDRTSPTMNNVIASATGGTNSYGVYNNDSSSPTMTNVTASASGGSYSNYGVYNTNSSNATIHHSVLSGVTALWSDSSGVTTYIGKTMLDGGVFGTGPTICAGVYDGDFVFYADTCP